MRLFIAIKLPRNIVEVLIKLQAFIINEADIDVRLVDPQNFHITLAFLGDCNQEQLQQIKVALQAIEQQSFTLCLDSCGVFPNFKHPRILWVSLLSTAAQEFVLKIQHAVLPIMALDERDFKAHVTLARIKMVRDAVTFKDLIEKVGVPKECFKVVNFVLFESHRTEKGSLYKALETYNLV